MEFGCELSDSRSVRACLPTIVELAVVLAVTDLALRPPRIGSFGICLTVQNRVGGVSEDVPGYPLRNILGPLMVGAEFVNEVRLDVLHEASRSGRVLDAGEVARRLGRSAGDVLEAFRQLAESHVYVLEPNDSTRLRMANPFSAVSTPFAVEVARRDYFGNCVWDALGIVSLLGGTGRVRTACPDCHEPMALDVSERRLAPFDAVVHFGIPARRWWDDIIHT